MLMMVEVNHVGYSTLLIVIVAATGVELHVCLMGCLYKNRGVIRLCLQ